MSATSVERPLAEVDAVAERMRSSERTAGSSGSALGRLRQDAQRAFRRLTADPRIVAVLAIGLFVAVSVVAAALRREPPRGAAEIALDRSRDLLDEGRRALEAFTSDLR